MTAIKLSASFILAFFFVGKSDAQMSITGPTCPAVGTQYTYTIAGNWTNSTSMTWSVTNGTITGSSSGTPLPHVTVTFTSLGAATVSVTTTTPSGSASLNVSATTALNPGTIGPATQSVNYNTIPQIGITSTALASGGSCSPVWVYQWQSSTDNVNFTNISSATSSSLSFTAPLTQTKYYRRQVTETTSGAVAYTSSVSIIVYPPLQVGSISNGTQSIDYNATPLAMSITASGGNSSYTYQWYSNAGGIWQAIPYALAATYAPGPLPGTTSFYVVVTSNGVSVTSANATITVSPQLQAGILSPLLVNIPSGTSPGIITCSIASGGQCNGSYTYTWQTSPDGQTWSTAGSGLYFNPGNLSAVTYYRLQVGCGSDLAYSAVGKVTIGVTAADMNFIRTRSFSKAGVTDTVTADGLTSIYDVQQTTTYFDGLGRPIQSVAKQASPLQRDMVSVQAYDPDGREVLKYLPYSSPASDADGNFKNYAFAEQNSFNSAQFPSDHYFYSQVSVEGSPLNRTLASYPQGDSWVYSGRGVTSQYLYNDVPDSVHIWNILFTTGSIPTDAGMYAAGMLAKTFSADEQGHQVVQYTDRDGHVVLKKVQVAASPGAGHVGWLCTYYVYDDFGNLRFVVSPQAVVLTDQGVTWTIPTGIANELCFRYEYDLRQRNIIKAIPGAGETHLVYDERDLPVMSQDANLRALQKWAFTCYDGLNRADSTGLMTDPSNYNNLPYHTNLALQSPTYPNLASYTTELMTRSFFDDYAAIDAASGLPASMATNYNSNGSYFVTTLNTSPTYAVALTAHPISRGLATGTMTKVIGTTNQYLYSESFYDDRGRPIQIQAINYTGGIDTVTSQYDFAGKQLRTLLNHTKSGNTVQHHVVVTKTDYDQAFRVGHIWKNIDGAAADQLIVFMQYNELGQLTSKSLGNNVDNLNYTYNIRGWLSGINPNYVAGSANNYFGMELGYDKSTSVAPGNTYATQEYNGNAEGLVWKSAGSGTNRKYDFSYDPVNRLTGANFGQYNGSGFDKSAGVDFSVSSLNYDANGNILNMTQNGFLVGGSQAIDVLSYSYLTGGSNKLMGVTDAANNPTSQLGDFHYNTGTKGSTDYAYDANGNLIQDANKVISVIHYNYLNLPDSVVFTGKGYIKYVYDAAGGKLAKTTVDNPAGKATVTTYLGGGVYQRSAAIPTGGNPVGGTDTLQFIGHEEGRARWAYHTYINGTKAYKLEYDFFEKDHLGNTRMVLTQERDTTNYLASMEYQYRGTELKLFGNIASTSAAWTSMPNYQNIPNNLRFNYTSPNDSVSKVDYNGTTGQTTGPSLLLKVMSGDTVSLGVQCYYATNTLTTTNSSLNSVLNTLAAGIMGTASGAAEGTLSGYTSTTGPVYGGLSSFLSTKDPASPSGYPKAYLNWILLDDQFNYVSSSSGSVATASTTYPANQMNQIAPGGPVVMGRNGYLYVWVSNETQGWDVFFDNLSVQYKQGPVLEENHYYPFGLSMAGISDKAMKGNYIENKFRFQKQELQNKEFSDGSGLEMYEFKYRFDDPQIGRFWSVDPKADQYAYNSVYAFSENHVIIDIELEGLELIHVNNDPNIVTFPGRQGESQGHVSNEVLQNGGYRPTYGMVIKSKWGLKVPKATVALNAIAGGAVGVKGFSAEGGQSETVIGIVDNNFHLLGKNKSDGNKETKTTGVTAGAWGEEGGVEKTETREDGGSWKEESSKTTERLAFVLLAETEKDEKTGVETTTISLDYGIALGLGLEFKAELKVPFLEMTTVSEYSEKQKKSKTSDTQTTSPH